MLLSAASPAPCQTKHIAPSPIASPMLIVMKPKKDPLDPPKYRAVVDYRRVNEYLKPLSYRMPTCDSLWYTLDRAKYISTADCADGYWLAPLDPSTSWMTAVDTPQGRMEWTCLPMGIQGLLEACDRGFLAARSSALTPRAQRAKLGATGGFAARCIRRCNLARAQTNSRIKPLRARNEIWLD